VLISIDTLRADALGCYGYPLGTSPRLDELASNAYVFERGYSHSPNTIVAHASLFTSLHPIAHGVRPDSPLPDTATTLAEELQAAGYVTAGFTTHGDWLNREKGFAQGFDHFDAEYRSARRTNKQIRRWLESEPTQQARSDGAPTFLFVHYYDVHSDWRKLPYETRTDYDLKFAGALEPGFDGCREETCASALLKEANSRPNHLSEHERNWVRALYDGGVAYTDAQVGHLFNLLAEHELFSDSWVIVTSDHGEEFLEHGRFLHSQPYEETARIPFLIRPPLGASGRRVELVVSTVDLMPTILDLAGVPLNESLEGRSLHPLFSGGNVDPRPHFFNDFARPERISVRADGYTLIRSGRKGVPRLFSDSDPSQSEDVAASEPDQLRALARVAKAFLETQEESKIQTGETKIEASPEELERLRSLGYLD